MKHGHSNMIFLNIVEGQTKVFPNTESKITVLLDIICSRYFVRSKHISSSGFKLENLPPSCTK